MRIIFHLILAGIVTFGWQSIEQASAVTYNLAADWSVASNPNGVWSYNQGASPLPFMQANWAGTGGDGWTTSASGIAPPAWLKAGVAFAGAAAGDVFVHSTNFDGALARVTWTSPAAGVIDIAGQAWNVDHAAGRDDEWTLYLNATALAHRNSILGVAKNTANAALATNLLLGQSLTNLAVNPGDVVAFEVHQTQNSFGHFSGVELSIALVPEPSGLLLAATGLLLLCAGRLARRGGQTTASLLT